MNENLQKAILVLNIAKDELHQSNKMTDCITLALLILNSYAEDISYNSELAIATINQFFN